MAKQVDHGQRRAEIAEALWRVAERDGLAAATVRGVAAEAGVSVGRVQHYFSTKDEMLLFALGWVGEEYGERITKKIGALPEPRDPYRVIRTVLIERLPRRPRSRVHVQALITWLGRSADSPEVGEYLLAGTRRLRDYLAAQVNQAIQDGRVPGGVDPVRTADGLLAFADGLASHVLQNLHKPRAAEAILTAHLDVLFGQSTSD